MKAPFLLGRLAFGGYFLHSGINHFRNRKAMAQTPALPRGVVGTKFPQRTEEMLAANERE